MSTLVINGRRSKLIVEGPFIGGDVLIRITGARGAMKATIFVDQIDLHWLCQELAPQLATGTTMRPVEKHGAVFDQVDVMSK